MYNLKDINKRKDFYNSEFNNKIIKSIKSNRLLKKNNFFFNKKAFSKTQIINSCIVSGRSRAVFRKFKISRIVLKNLSGLHQIKGFKKDSW